MSRAVRMHNRLGRTCRPAMAVLTQMATLISKWQSAGRGTAGDEQQRLYNVTLRNFIAPRDQSRAVGVRAANDYIAT